MRILIVLCILTVGLLAAAPVEAKSCTYTGSFGPDLEATQASIERVPAFATCTVDMFAPQANVSNATTFVQDNIQILNQGAQGMRRDATCGITMNARPIVC